MTTQAPTIIGAGLAGLIAAHAWPSAQIIESSPAYLPAHRALLRFRSKAVANLTGIDFRQVLVRKGIWSSGEFVQPSIRLANQYAQKCIGVLAAERSIWSLEPVERFIAPNDFHERLLGATRERIVFGVDAFSAGLKPPFVSTAPLPVVAEKCGLLLPASTFLKAPIRVRRYDLGANCDLYQTIYFPDSTLNVYRASITGRTLIVESVDLPASASGGWRPDGNDEVFDAFGITGANWTGLGEVNQQYGKIAHMDDDDSRRALLFQLTYDFGIYSLGRFATWRNILLDDVVQDISVVKRLMKSGGYELRHTSSSPSSAARVLE